MLDENWQDVAHAPQYLKPFQLTNEFYKQRYIYSGYLIQKLVVTTPLASPTRNVQDKDTSVD